MHQFNVQSYYNDFILCLQDLIEKYVPKAQKRNTKPKAPKYIRTLLNKKIRMYKQQKRNKSLKSKYKQICKQYEEAVHNGQIARRIIYATNQHLENFMDS